MRHKKKRDLPRKCGPPRSKSYCATRSNATKRGQFCHFGLLLASSWGPPHKLSKILRFPKLPHKLPKIGRFPKLPYKEFNSAGTASILQFLTFLGLHFLAFWPCGPSFPCILALWAFISLHFGLVGLHFLAFWPCGPSFPCNFAFSESASGVPPTSCQKWPVCPTSLQWIY